MAAGLQTEYSFVLPKGYVDSVGMLHRHGVMRLATARDEIEPLRSREIEGPDDPYLTVLVLARVIKELGSLDDVTTAIVEGLFAADLAFLQDLYGIINFGDPSEVAVLQSMVVDHDNTDTDGFGGHESDDASAAPDATMAGGESLRSVRPQAHVEEVPRASAP